jgi:hypothetical protein
MAVPAPQQTDSLDAIGKLHAAFKSGFLDTSDIIDNITVQPSKRRAAVATNEDTISQSAANIEARPANTRRKIAEDTLGADTAGANSGLLGEATAVKRASLRDQMDEFGISGLERTNKSAKLRTEASLLDAQGDIARAQTEEERALAQARLGRIQSTLAADNNKWTVFSDDLHRKVGDPAGTKAAYEGVLTAAGALDVPAGTLTLPQLAQKVSDLRRREYEQALKLTQLGKQKSPEDIAAGLRKEFDDAPEVKQFRVVQSATAKLEASAGKPNPTPADDMSTVFSYMKILDPGSTVREGEYASAQNTAGIPDRVLNAYNKAVEGTFLSPEQRRDFLASGREAFTGQKKTFANLAGRQARLANQSGIPLADVFGPEDLQHVPGATPAAAPKAGTQGARMYNFPSKDGRPAFRGLGVPNPANPNKIIPVNELP